MKKAPETRERDLWIAGVGVKIARWSDAAFLLVFGTPRALLGVTEGLKLLKLLYITINY